MTPLPQNPKVLILVDSNTGERLETATNVAPDLEVNITNDKAYFDEQAKSLPFVN